MMWRIVLLFLFWLGPLPGLAQVSTIPVRGGEHDAYTRIVIQIPEDNTWRVTTEGSSATVQFSGPPIIFDLSQTFARIPRSRLRDVAPIDAGLLLTLACLCEVRASEDIPQFLVIDIIGHGADIARAPSTAPRPRARPVSLASDAEAHIEAARSAGREVARVMRSDQPELRATGPLTLAQLFPDTRNDASDRSTAQGNAPFPRAEMVATLAQTLARNVSVGVLEGGQDFRAPETPASGELPNRPFAAALAQIRMTDTPRNADSAADPDRVCPSPELLELPYPGDAGPQADHARLIREVHGEFDRIDPTAVIALARHYLAKGFGAEARMTLVLLDPTSEVSLPLREISFLLDLSRPENPQRLLALTECGMMGAFWAFLAQDEAIRPEQAQLDLVVQAISALPAHLRLHLGPGIIKRLVQHEFLDHARMIRDALDRVTETPTPELALAATQIALSNVPAENPRRIEAGLSPEGSDSTLIFLLEHHLAEAAPIEAEIIALAQSRLPVLRRSDDGRTLAELLIKALARNGAFAEAFALLDDRTKDLEDDRAAQLRTEVLAGLVQAAADAEFVTSVFAQRPWEDMDLPTPTRAALAQRLRGLGFSLQAALLEAAGNAPDGANERQTPPYNPETAWTRTPPGIAAPVELLLNQGNAGFVPEQAQISESDPVIARDRAAVAATRDTAPENGSGVPTAVATLDRPAPIPEQRQIEAPRAPLSTDAPLAQGRALLDETAALRERLSTLLSTTATE